MTPEPIATATVPLPDTARAACADRRTLLRAAGLAGAACAAGTGLAACSSTPSAASGNSPATQGAASSPAAVGAPSSAAPAASATGQTGGNSALGTTSQIPVGGGMIFTAERVVVTQPTAGTFKAFSSTCTHMGCQVTQVTGGLIECPCHGSEYSIVDGSVKAGPAPRPLAAATITVTGGQVFLSA